jgi:hypothetical protein
MAPRIDREGPIHKAILEYLRRALPGAMIHHSANELDIGGDRRAKAIAQGKAKAKGMMPGFPDLIILWCGRFLAIEVKADGNYPDPQQRDVGALIEKNGGTWAWARSVTEAEKIVKAWRAMVQP